jgi:hypothetical protein
MPLPGKNAWPTSKAANVTNSLRIQQQTNAPTAQTPAIIISCWRSTGKRNIFRNCSDTPAIAFSWERRAPARHLAAILAARKKRANTATGVPGTAAGRPQNAELGLGVPRVSKTLLFGPSAFSLNRFSLSEQLPSFNEKTHIWFGL